MKIIFKVVVLSIAFLALASSASANTITLSSGNGSSSSHWNGALEFLGTTPLDSNWMTDLVAPMDPTAASSSQTSYDTSAAGVWANAIAGTSWVANTPLAGPGCSGSQCDPGGFYYYWTTFNAAGGTIPNNGSVSVMADDTAEVLLNGMVIVPFGSIGADNHCSDGGPNCSAIDTLSLSGIPLNAGTNTLEIIDAQTGGGPAGVDLSTNLASGPSSMLSPEPSTLLLLGTGLLGLAFGLFRKGRPALHVNV